MPQYCLNKLAFGKFHKALQVTCETSGSLMKMTSKVSRRSVVYVVPISSRRPQERFSRYKELPTTVS